MSWLSVRPSVTTPTTSGWISTRYTTPVERGDNAELGYRPTASQGNHPIRSESLFGKHVVCIVCVMTRVNVYLPDALAVQAKEAGLNVSAVTQDAIRRSLAARSTDEWLDTLPDSPRTGRVSHDVALQTLDETRLEAPTRHG